MKSFALVAAGLIGLALTSIPSRASTLSDDLIGNLYVMKSVYDAEYAPAAWKKSYANYDLDTEFKKAVTAARAKPDMTMRDAREVLKNFIYAMKDYHTSISFTSTESATLPFTVEGAQGRYFIVDIDRTKLPESSFPFHVGDEVMTFDGKPTAQAVADVQSQIPANVPETDRMLASLRLTSRAGARGLDVPQGPVTIGLKRKGSTDVVDFQMVWDYTPELIHPRADLATIPMDIEPGRQIVRKSAAFHPIMTADVADSAPSVGSPYDLGARKTFTPDLGTKIWESASSDLFYAYVYKAEGGKLIGYIRIPGYEAPDYTKAVAEFARDITLFESTTDALIIDQVDNPGGSVFYLYELASMLSPQPLVTPLHRMSITQSDVADALRQIKQLSAVKTDADAKKIFGPGETNGYPASYEFAQFTLNYARFIVNQWNQGRKLTTPYWIAGVDHINPAPTHYTKPILLLINHLDFSGGDFFPTILQDNKRVTIMGSRTAGAGGYVNDVPVPNNVGINAFRCTESIAERVNKKPIENLGVTPDIPYEMTVNDYQNNYKDYVAAIKKAIEGLHDADQALGK